MASIRPAEHVVDIAGPGIIHRRSDLVRHGTHRRGTQRPQLDLDFRHQRYIDHHRRRRLPVDMPGTGGDGLVLDPTREGGGQGTRQGEYEQSGGQGLEVGWDGRGVVALAGSAGMDT